MDTGNSTPQGAQKDAWRDAPTDVSFTTDNPDVEGRFDAARWQHHN
jgi:hypothetical protein